MKLLITGGKGQLAREIRDIIEKQQSDIGPIPYPLRLEDVTFIDIGELDIADDKKTEEYFESRTFDVVINCAAMTNVDACETNLEQAMRANAIGVRNLGRQCESMGAKLVHVSTDYVFNGKGDTPFAEWDTCNPQSIYGKSKLLGEQYVRAFCSRYFIVRTAWLYGQFGNNFVKSIAKAGKEKGQLKVVNDQVGSPTNANDLAHHLLKIIGTNEYGIYHCTGEGVCSWYDFACKIIAYSKIDCIVSPCTTEEFPRPAKRPAYSVLDNVMLKSTVGNEMRDWQDALKSFINKGAYL